MSGSFTRPDRNLSNVDRDHLRNCGMSMNETERGLGRKIPPSEGLLVLNNTDRLQLRRKRMAQSPAFLRGSNIHGRLANDPLRSRSLATF